MTVQQYFYSGEIRRFLLQVSRIFSNFQVAYNTSDGSGNVIYSTIPVRYSDSSRQASTIIKNNSENSLNNAPAISFYISNLKYDRDRIQDPTFTDKFNIKNKQFDIATQQYLPSQGNSYSVERLMPSPYLMNIRVDVWSSNTQQKLEILEQILPLFNPSLEIQSTDNYIDWTSLTTIELVDVTWSSRSIPVGSDDSIDIATMEFQIPIWLSVPAKVKKMGSYIASIISNIDFINGCDIFNSSSRSVITFNNYDIFVNNGIIKLLPENQYLTTKNSLDIGNVSGTAQNWAAATSPYGNIKPGISQIGLTYFNNSNSFSEILGSITINPLDPLQLLYSVDPQTLPENTLDPITEIINPLEVAPGINGLQSAQIGQRYLLTNNIGNVNNSNNAAIGWTFNNIPTIAKTNDIIQFNGNNWDISFNSTDNNIQYVTSLSTNFQYKWTGKIWKEGWQGLYKAGMWRLII